ncbi:MAG: surface-adhesin E family protein [Pseudomonadota bacterium]
MVHLVWAGFDLLDHGFHQSFQGITGSFSLHDNINQLVNGIVELCNLLLSLFLACLKLNQLVSQLIHHMAVILNGFRHTVHARNIRRSDHERLSTWLLWAIGSCILAPNSTLARKRNLMKPAFFLLAALLLPASSASANNWHVLQNNSQILLEAGEPQQEEYENNDQDNAKKKEKTLKVWSKSTYSRPEQARPGDFYFSSAKALLTINCTKRSHRLLQKIYYAADGQEIKSVRYGKDEKIEAIVPDSAEERVFDFACSFKAAKGNNKSPNRTKPKSTVTAEKPATSEKTSKPETISEKPANKAASKGNNSAPDKSKTAKPKNGESTPPKR